MILTVRDNPDKWVESVRATIFPVESTKKSDSNSARQEFFDSFDACVTKVHGVDPGKPETDLGTLYLEWNEEVKKNVKEENLLVFNVKEGWDPLCKFLDVPEPEQPLPNVNSSEAFQKGVAKRRLAKQN